MTLTAQAAHMSELRAENLKLIAVAALMSAENIRQSAEITRLSHELAIANAHATIDAGRLKRAAAELGAAA